jgi:hypothetical protein
MMEPMSGDVDGDEEADSGELEDPSGEGSLESAAEAACPWCGERITIPPDPPAGPFSRGRPAPRRHPETGPPGVESAPP